MKQGARVVLSSGLALWLGFYPVFQALHLSFADHDHCLCPEHRQIEDVPRATCSAIRTYPEPGESAARLAGGTARVSGPTDLLLSFSLQDSVSKRVQPTWIPYHGSYQGVASRPSEVVIIRSHLRIAPKTSPPSLAAC